MSIKRLFRGDLVVTISNPPTDSGLVVSSIIYRSKTFTIERTLKRTVGVGTDICSNSQLLVDLINKERWHVIRWYNFRNWLVRLCILFNIPFELY